MTDSRALNAVVVGATMRGLVTAYVLDRLGCRAVVLEPSPRVGGADGSFVTEQGTVFDHGLHVLDSMRSPLATRLFTHVMGGEVNRVVLRRAIVLRGHVIPYAPAAGDLPDELRAMLPGDELVDDIGGDLPTRERLARCYGPGFADLVFDEVLPSFPVEARHLAFGVDEARLLANIYPWFFPRARRAPSADESRAFHDRLRSGIPQEILYPRRGGFGAFADAFVAALDPERVTVAAGVGDIRLEVAPGTHTVEWVEACGRQFHAPLVFWAGSWPVLCRALGLRCQDAATDRVVLGSFRFDRPALTDHHEILVGDPRYRVNRVHFPAAFRGTGEALAQVEFAYPVREEGWNDDAGEWRSRWLDDLGHLGLLDDSHRVEEFHFRAFTMHFNGYGAEGEPLRDADPSLVRPDSNVVPVVPSMANLNLNRYVPRAVRDVTTALARLRAD